MRRAARQLAAVLLLPAAWACSAPQARRGPAAEAVPTRAAPAATSPSRDETVSSPASRPAGARPRLHALLINGGGNVDDNFRSHLLHLREMQALLARAGVAGEALTVLASDGDDPRADVARRDPDPASFWLLEGTALVRFLEEPIRYEDTTLPGVRLLPATRAAMKRSLEQQRRQLAPGDTLLLYVTDHGTDDPRDARGNSITLWGRSESIDVRQLSAELERLPVGVRVVAVMSQCFSGGFAHLLDVHSRGDLPSGDVCGYFASTADRPAFGCYPEAGADDRVGHSFALLDGLQQQGGSLAAAHAQVLVRDQTPDVPLRTSDAFLAERLRLAARALGASGNETAFFDKHLAADQARKAESEELALAEQVATTFGLGRPATLAELQPALKETTALREQLDRFRQLWQTALADMTRAEVDRFLRAEPRWRARLHPRLLRKLSDGPRRTVTGELLAALSAAAARAPDDEQRLEQLLEKVDAAAAAHYRMEVREAALLRMRILFTSAAGRAYLQTSGSSEERAALTALAGCEALNLPGLAGAPPPPATPRPAEVFPPLAEDRQLAASLRPSWLGIAFKSAAATLRARLKLADGAALITAVEPGSPADAGGLRSGDIVLGLPDAPFDRENQVRSFTMLSPAGRRQPLAILRGDQRMTVQVTPAALPTEPPSTSRLGRQERGQERNRAK